MSTFYVDALHVSQTKSGLTEIAGQPMRDFAREIAETIVRAMSDKDDPLYDAVDEFRAALAVVDELGPSPRGEDRYHGGAFDERANAAGVADRAFDKLEQDLPGELFLDMRTAAGLGAALVATAQPGLRRAA